MQKVTFSRFVWDKANHSKCQEHGVSVLKWSMFLLMRRP